MVKVKAKCPRCKNAFEHEVDLSEVIEREATKKAQNLAPSSKITKEVISDKYIDRWREICIENPYMNINDWFEFYGFENKQPNISKDEARSIIKKLSLKPFDSKFKIIILWDGFT